jgi:hypothetical protein
MGFNLRMNHGKGSIIRCLLSMILFVGCSIPFFRLLCDCSSTEFSSQDEFSYFQNQTQAVSVAVMGLLPLEEDVDPDEWATNLCKSVLKKNSWAIPALVNFLVHVESNSLWLHYRNIRI